MGVEKNRGFLLKSLDRIEKAGNALPHPATLFFILSVIVIIVSALCAKLGVTVTYDYFDSTQGKIVQKTVNAISLLSTDGIRFMLTSVVPNFTGFFALGTVFTVMLGVAVAEGTGFLTTVLRRLATVTPKWALTPTVVFIGVMSNVASSSGYVVFVPLGAILFLSFKRHPIAGLAATFAGVSGGWSANLLLGSNDPLFAGISTQAAHILDPGYNVLPTANWYFMVASTFLVTLVGTLVTEKIVEPRLGAYDFSEEVTVEGISEHEKRGMKWALVSFLIFFALVLAGLLPSGSLLRNPETGGILQSPFMSSIIFFMMMFFLIPGLFYGIGAKVIKNDKEVIELMVKTIAGISGFFVLIFFAGQFVAHFNYSNLGTIISVKGAEFLANAGFIGLPLIVTFIFLTAFINLFIAVDTAKWALMAPIFVPMFMRLGLSPELTQAAYRIGDSSTNIIAPLMPFFALIVAYCQKYDKKSGIGTLISTMLPYSIAILLAWTALIVVWYLLGIPVGPGAPLLYPSL